MESIQFIDQIVLVDSGSSDNTVEVARDYGCEVFIEAWRGFGPQKQFAIDHCRNQWILVLDADERIPPETAVAIKRLFEKGMESCTGYSFPRRNYFQGRWIRHMGWWPDRVVRLFRKDSGRMSPTMVHEAVIVSGLVQELEFPIDHYTESNLSNILKKIDHYSSLGAQQAYREGKKTSEWASGLRMLLTFLQDYLLRLGFLDGAQGLTLSVTDSINKFFKYAKLNELHLNAKRSRTDLAKGKQFQDKEAED